MTPLGDEYVLFSSSLVRGTLRYIRHFHFVSEYLHIHNRGAFLHWMAILFSPPPSSTHRYCRPSAAASLCGVTVSQLEWHRVEMNK